MTKLNSNDQISPGAGWDAELKAEIEANKMNGRVGQHLISETEDVRVWRLALKPGERAGFHRHVLNYFWVAVTPGRSRSHYATGDVKEAVYKAGDVMHFQFDKGEFMLHDLNNIGDTELIFTTVEFKNSANRPLPV